MRTSLRGIANKARNDPKHRFRNLWQLLNVEGLLSSWRYLNKRSAGGVDRVSVREYGKNLRANVLSLVERLKRGAYRARLVGRKTIPKSDGGTRPLGLPVVEDKLLQRCGSRILEAIFEQDFLPCSYAYRRGRGALQAVRDLTQELQFGCYGYIVEIDIKAFFDNIDHDWMLRMLKQRIDDRPFLRLIKKWLKAGILEEDGEVIHPHTGCPQGGVISPVLANIYLHYVLDLWFEKVVRPRCRARAYMIRFADDAVFAFQYQHEAERFYRVVGKRLAKFGLEVSAKKSRITRFSRFQLAKKSKGFEFLGFEFRWVPDRQGVPRVTKRTAPSRLRRALRDFTDWAKDQRHTRMRDLMATYRSKLRGHYNYFGVIRNHASLQVYYTQTRRILKKWLNRRSQRRSYNWRGYKAMLLHFRVPTPRITEVRYRQLVLETSC